jgi:hypothetical protein
LKEATGMGMALFESLCKLCKHRRGLACAAFPEGIPLEIRQMHVDHRNPYPGDGGITFEPKDDSEQTRRRLQQVHLRKGRVPAGTNELDRRIRSLWKKIRFEDARQQSRFARCVQAVNRFEDLPEWCRKIVLEVEGVQDHEMKQPGAEA